METNVRRRKQKLTLVERVDQIEELLGQIDGIIKQSPKRKASEKLEKPAQTVQEVPQAVFDWLAYYQVQLDSLRDQQRANSLRQQLDRNAELIRAIIAQNVQNAQIEQEMLQMQQDEEVLMLFLMAA